MAGAEAILETLLLVREPVWGRAGPAQARRDPLGLCSTVPSRWPGFWLVGSPLQWCAHPEEPSAFGDLALEVTWRHFQALRG